ncbi:L,D-transpeptidase family protein [Streptomyces longispororuber]|uniref:L,D-transpeptidase family protein n=1 Tax=Streptomyces longispororuber TaxID=68230 RepID=UPI00210A4515|nr:L,D-transpeptidase family protein [Streptomyces longispororuber]MCQ4212443.1 L,D-transpeptidase family protein [Streptomyces longispororuber]
MTSTLVRGGVAALLALAAALPAGPALADPVPPRPAAPAQGPALVPGIPLAPYDTRPLDTPDQALPPRVYEPSAAEDAVEPYEPPLGSDPLVEYVPPSEVPAAPGSLGAPAAATCTKKTGTHQRKVERWLRLKVDGKQSPADCRAIRAFQTKQGIRPNIGYAGPVTWARMQWLSARKNPNAAKKCPTRAYRLACVDLPRQLMWVTKGKKVVFGPVPIRSGRAGYATRTGWHKVYWKHKNHWSTLYNTPMPYSQFFSGGQAFHAIYGNVYNPPGSRGCVNMRLGDAKRLWGVLKKGDRVYVWGRKPGT